MRILIKNGSVLNASGELIKKDIRIENGQITAIEDILPQQGEDVIDAADAYVLPGFIDLNCYIPDPGHEYKEDIPSASKSAAKGGFTSLTCLPDTEPTIDNKTVVHYIVSKRQQESLVHLFPYGNITKGGKGEVLSEISDMKNAGIVGLSDGNISIANTGLLRNTLLYSRMFDLPIITICDDPNLSANGVMNMGKTATMIGLNGIPVEAEETVISRNIILAGHTQSRLHITHISTAGSVSLIRAAKKGNISVTCDTCPHYFTLSEEILENYNSFGKIKPPLRTQKDIEAILEGLADGTIDAIASGHSPCTIESKYLEFDRASFGISSLETAFSCSYTALVASKILTMQQLTDKFSTFPAQFLKLENKGHIKIGFDADITIIDPDKTFRVNPLNFASKAKFSPYAGHEFKGKVKATIVSGEIVYLDKEE